MILCFWNTMKSKTLAYYLIVVIIIESVIGALLPQNGLSFYGYNSLVSKFPQYAIYLKKAGLLPFFSSWLFIATISLFFLNTFCCTIEQAIKARRVKSIEKWGTVFFHISLLLIIIGTILTQALKFEGEFILNEGQSWSNMPENYYRYSTGLLYRTWMSPEIELYLEKFNAVYPADDVPQHLTSHVKISENGVVTSNKIIKVAKPIHYKSITFYQIKHGYSPELTLVDRKGKTLLDAVISLSTENINGEEYKDSIDLPDSDLHLEIHFIPNYRQGEGNNEHTINLNPINPGIIISVEDSHQRKLFKGPLLLGKEVKFHGYVLKFPDYRKWSGLATVFDPGYPLIFVGFILGTIGLGLMFYRKILWCAEKE